MMCKGNCSREAKYGEWCGKLPIHCPVLKKKFNQNRIRKISETKKLQAKLGLNPMQNPEICEKNHSQERNRKASQSLKKLGELGLLPQQLESQELKEKRKLNISLRLQELYSQGIHPRQREGQEKRRQRLDKMALRLRELGKEGKLPIQNMTDDEKRVFGEKISKTLINGIKSGRIKLSPSWKKVPYNNLILRSNWEKVVAEFLDKNDLKWEYESMKFNYWDSQRNITAITIPDFFVPSLNAIIEVKSNAEFKSLKTKSKLEAIKNNGFRVFLVGRKEIEKIKNNEQEFLNELRGN